MVFGNSERGARPPLTVPMDPKGGTVGGHVIISLCVCVCGDRLGPLFDNNRDSWGFALPRTQPKAARGNLGSCVRDVTVDPGSGVVREHSAWCFPNVCKAMGYSRGGSRGGWVTGSFILRPQSAHSVRFGW